MVARSTGGLSPRQAAILAAVVEEHVQTAAPVGSKAVQERYGVAASTATIRHEMWLLEQGGYIEQPHTSAGRVPADKGYRAYVDGIMPERSPKVEELAWVHSEYRRAGRSEEDLYRTTSRVLSQLTSAPAMVMAPPDEPVILTALKLTPVSANIVLLTYETQPGGRHECLVEASETLTAAQVASLSEALARRYCGRETGALSLCQPATLDDDMAPHAVPAGLLDEIKTALERDRLQRVYVDGAAYALDYPEYQTLERLRPVMAALDEESVLRRLLRPAARRGRLTITIGREHEVRSLQACSLVASHYPGPMDLVGALGVIGPTRMNYAAVVAAVRCVAEHVSEALTSRRTS